MTNQPKLLPDASNMPAIADLLAVYAEWLAKKRAKPTKKRRAAKK